MPPSVACEQGAIMPDIRFNLAGKIFTLTPYDYTFEWPIEQSRTRCVSAIMPFGVEQYDEIVLGSAFYEPFTRSSIWTRIPWDVSRPFLSFALRITRSILILSSRSFSFVSLSPSVQCMAFQVRILVLLAKVGLGSRLNVSFWDGNLTTV